MATDNSPQRKIRNQRKWDSLQDSGQSHIDKILSGQSTEADLTALSETLRQQHELAGDIFDRAVEDAINTANAIVKAADEKRQASGKKAMTDKVQDRMFEKTLRDVMAASIEDILGQVYDEFETHNKEVKDKVNEALDRIRDFEPREEKREPAPGEVTPTRKPRSQLDRLTEPRSEESEHGSRSLADRVFDNQRRSQERARSSVMQVLKDAAVSAKDKIGALYARVRGRDDGDEEKRASIWMRKLRTIFDPLKKGYDKVRAGGGMVGGLLSKIGLPLMAALMNPKLLESISDAVSKHLSFEQISKYVENMWNEAKQMGSTALDAVVAKIKTFFGVKEKPKPRVQTKVDALKFKPVVGELPKSITAAMASAELPRREAQLEAAKTRLEQAKAAYAKNPTETTKRAVESAQNTFNLLSMRVTQFKSRANTGEVSKEQAQIAVSSTPVGEVPKTSTPASADIPQQTSPVTPTQIQGKSSASTAVVGDLPKLTPGRAFDPPSAQDEIQQMEMQKGAALSQIGIGSFGFDSGDSAMNILNLGMLT